MGDDASIPIHGFEHKAIINVEKISHDNKYDFHRIHRHKYFEILFFINGGGEQLIDFDGFDIKNHSCYMVKPRQVHLMKRAKEADGYLIQFYNMSVSRELKNSLSILQYHNNIPVVFEKNKELTEKMVAFVKMLLDLKDSECSFKQEKMGHILALVLYELETEVADVYRSKKGIDQTLLKFTRLVDGHLNGFSVKEYAAMLNISTNKLTELLKVMYGITPLKFIHKALILEIKRELIFNDLNIKEICFKFNFDSLSNFSLFVKKNTGFSPKELQKALRR